MTLIWTPNVKPQEQVQKVVTLDKEETVQAPGWPKRTERIPTWKYSVANAARMEPEYRSWTETPKKKTTD